MNTWHDSIDVLNHRCIVEKGSVQVDQICKLGRKQCEKAPLLNPAVKLCLPEISFPLLDLLCPGYALLHISPCQFGVNLTIIWLDILHSPLQAPNNICARKYMVKRGLGGENGVITVFRLQCIHTDPKLSTIVTRNPHNICLQDKTLHDLHGRLR